MAPYPSRDGRIVEGLTPADFEVYEDGRLQTIEDLQFIRIEPNTPVADCGVSLDAEFKAPSWTLSLDWQVNPDTLLYVATRRGFPGGGRGLPGRPRGGGGGCCGRGGVRGVVGLAGGDDPRLRTEGYGIAGAPPRHWTPQVFSTCSRD